VVVPVAEYQVWRDDESDYEMKDEAMIEKNLDQAWAAYWRSFPLSELLTMRETAVRDIEGIDRAIGGARFAEKMAAVEIKIDREVLARFERGEYPACFPGSQWWWHREGSSHLGPVSGAEFDAIKRLTDNGLLKHETR
jgi:hypothetical protein